jgi:hypothetical protein
VRGFQVLSCRFPAACKLRICASLRHIDPSF